MVRVFSKFPKKPAGWVAPSAPLSERKQVFLYVKPYLPIELFRVLVILGKN